MVPLTALQRVEYIDSITFSENTSQTLRTNGGLIPNDRFLSCLILEFRGRLTMPGSTGPSADRSQPAGIIERVTVEGYHRLRRQQERFIDLRGVELDNIQRIYQPGGMVRQGAISVTASATTEIIHQLVVPFTPLRMPAAVQAAYLLDAPNYESLKLTVQWADFKNVVVPGTTAATWSAYGSASGSPELRVYGGFAMQKARFASFVPGRVFRYFQEITGSSMTTTATGQRIFDIPRGFDIRGLMLKTGVKATDTTSGNNAYSSLTEFLTDIRVNQGLGKYIRRYLNNDAIQADLAMSYNVASKITGVHPIDFAQYGDINECLPTRNLIAGPTGNVDLYLQADVTGSSNQAAVVALEEIRYKPLSA